MSIDWKALGGLYSSETDPEVMRDRLAGGSIDHTANMFADKFHDRLRKFSVSELIDIVCVLAHVEEDGGEEAIEQIKEAINDVLLTRYMNRHPEAAE